jgi:carbonic anhydrase/acetyltransferase-like protein (isoleucine patch superfamily)
MPHQVQSMSQLVTKYRILILIPKTIVAHVISRDAIIIGRIALFSDVDMYPPSEHHGGPVGAIGSAKSTAIQRESPVRADSVIATD